MRVVLENRLVTDPVLATVASEVTSLLNSRPLTHLSVDPHDPDPLTPNHFFHAGARLYSPLKSTSAITQTTERQFKLSQEIVDHFWKRRLREYVPSLTARKKWTHNTEALAVDDIVIITNELNPRVQWPLARIVDFIKGTDGVIRVAKVQTSNGKHVLTRPVTRLCRLLTSKARSPAIKKENAKNEENRELFLIVTHFVYLKLYLCCKTRRQLS